MNDMDAQFARIDAILGERDGLTFGQVLERFYDHLTESLELPCEVTGIEDFDWEEFYVFGPGDRKEYEQLRQTQPSYQDEYDLLGIEKGVISEWMMFHGEDLAARVRRKSDGKEFYLGLAEICALDENSTNHQLIDDYAVWFVNNR